MRVTKANTAQSCAICERTLLMGEYTSRFSADGIEFHDVCPLCVDVALDQGWVREGVQVSPSIGLPSRRRKSFLGSLLGARPREAEPVVSEPILRRLDDDELGLVEAAELFNASQFHRTIAGVAKALGPPRISIVRVPGVNDETVLTFAWDITWYQYRVAPEASQPVRVEERGSDLTDLSASFTTWNAELSDDGRVVPSIATP